MGAHPQISYGELTVDSSDIDEIRKYFDLYKDEATSLSDAQHADLNIDDLFDYSNRCITPIGEMLLYHRLRHLSKPGNAATCEKIITRIDEDSAFREKIENALSRSADKRDRSVSSLLNMSVVLSKWHRYFRFLPMLYIALVVIMSVFTSASATLAACLAIFVFNTFIHYRNKSYVEVYIRPLVRLNNIRTAAIELSKIDSYHSLAHIRESVDEIGKTCKKVSVFSLNKLLESDWMIVVLTATEIVKTLFLVEPILTNSILKKIGNVNLHAKRLVDYLGEWDVLYSIGSFRAWMTRNNCFWSIPAFTESSGCVRIEEMVHPLIPHCVPNSIAIDRSIIITGSNMSGKSSFLKTIGVNIVASYAMNICFAKRLELPDCNLYTVISVSDDINNAKSYYFSEAERIKKVIDKCGNTPPNRCNIVLIDEIFKGTNTIERISIAYAVIRYFAEQNNTIALVSTHDIELARSFRNILCTYHFSEEMRQEGLRFNYKLMPGIEYTRNAITILKTCGYPQEIIDSAESSSRKICKIMDDIAL